MRNDRAYMTLALICRAFQGNPHASQDNLIAMYEDWLEICPVSDPNDDRIVDLVQELDQAGLTLRDDYFEIDINTLPVSLCAMYFDQKLRHGGDILRNLAALLDVIPLHRRHS